MIKCVYCEKEFSNMGIGPHIWRKHTEKGKEFESNRKFKKGIVTWNKGKTYDELLGSDKSKLIKRKISNKMIGKGHPCSDLTKQKLSLIAKKNGFGGYTKGGGIGKKGSYKGFWCDSSWELAWVIYNLEHNIKFIRNENSFDYIYKNKKYKYYPDFRLNDNTYVEIKGWMTNKSEEKIKQFPGKLVVLFQKEMNYIFEYVKNKYGKDFIKLYETDGSKKRFNNKYCSCGNVIGKRAKRCKECSIKNSRKVVERPKKELLLNDVKEIGYSATGRKYGVSGNCIKKWLINSPLKAKT